MVKRDGLHLLIVHDLQAMAMIVMSMIVVVMAMVVP